MNQVSQSKIDKILSIYEQPFVFVKSVETDYPLSLGKCIVGQTKYTSEKLEHLTAIEAQFCINQLSYVAFSEWVEEKRFDELDLSLDDYIFYMKEHMLIAKTETQIQFKDKIKAYEEFSVEGKLHKFKKQEDNYFAIMDYDFEQGKAKGRMMLCLER